MSLPFPTATDWFLLWLGLDTNELVFLLFRDGTTDFNEISNIIGNIGVSKKTNR